MMDYRCSPNQPTWTIHVQHPHTVSSPISLHNLFARGPAPSLGLSGSNGMDNPHHGNRIFLTGVMIAAVPDPKTSKTPSHPMQMINSWMVIGASITSNSPHCLHRLRMESRVTPGKMVPSNGGVISCHLCEFCRDFQNTKAFIEPTSVIC